MKPTSDLRTTAFYGMDLLSRNQFYRIGLGMYGGPRGSYGKYMTSPITVQAVQNKKDRER